MNKPDISVVMSVFNSASTLQATLDSVLDQNGVDLEIVAINDGSTDNSGQILSDCAASDPRITVIHQENRGLTRSLIRACALAQGEFIARQDAGGDVSLPDRFYHQMSFLRAHPEVILTACGTRVRGPRGETLYEVRQYGEELHMRLQGDSSGGFGGPSHHGAVMFRKSGYERAGGYRDAFIVAQDIDLWSRMVEIGLCTATPDIFYETYLTKDSISHLNRDQQRRATEIVKRCAKARKEGEDDSTILDGIGITKTHSRSLLSERMRDARLYYFVGSMLRKRNTRRARAYFLDSLASCPVYFRAWLGLLRSFEMPRAVSSPDMATPRHNVRKSSVQSERDSTY